MYIVLHPATSSFSLLSLSFPNLCILYHALSFCGERLALSRHSSFYRRASYEPALNPFADPDDGQDLSDYDDE